MASSAFAMHDTPSFRRISVSEAVQVGNTLKKQYQCTLAWPAQTAAGTLQRDWYATLTDDLGTTTGGVKYKGAQFKLPPGASITKLTLVPDDDTKAQFATTANVGADKPKGEYALAFFETFAHKVTTGNTGTVYAPRGTFYTTSATAASVHQPTTALTFSTSDLGKAVVVKQGNSGVANSNVGLQSNAWGTYYSKFHPGIVVDTTEDDSNAVIPAANAPRVFPMAVINLFGKGTYSSAHIDLAALTGATYARDESTYWGAAWVAPEECKASTPAGETTWRGQTFRVLVEAEVPMESKAESDAYYAKGY